MNQKTDYLIIGAGIIGLAIARELRSRFPEADITILEKEPDVAYHSSGRNSGVLHAGFY
jgi:L-2-hydroxyglutarate oxidase